MQEIRTISRTLTQQGGLYTFQPLTGDSALAQRVKDRLAVIKLGRKYEPEDAIPWLDYLSRPALYPVMGQLIGRVIMNTSETVTRVDLEEAEVNAEPFVLRGVAYYVNDRRCTL